MQDFNLCAIFVEEMEKLQFLPSSIDRIRQDPQFIKAMDQDPSVQKMMLTLLINHIFIMGPFVVPFDIRLSLNLATDAQGWSDDLKIVLLPFLKANEEHFFPAA